MKQHEQVSDPVNPGVTSVRQSLRQWYFSQTFVWILAAAGTLLHTAQYLFNRSLWVDEAALALNILDKTYADLLRPLASHQSAPIGFLLGEKALVQLLGNSEYVLRLIPFLSAIVALILFARIASRVLTPLGLPPAMLLFAVSGRFIYHSSALKQYSSDLLVTLILTAAALEVLTKQLTLTRLIGFGLIGAAAIWCSHPAVFSLAGIGTWISGAALVKKNYTRFRKSLVPPVLWLASFAGVYMVSLRHAMKSEYLRQFWGSGFMPLPPTSWNDLGWFASKLFEVPGYLLEYPHSLLKLLSRLGQILASLIGLRPSLNIPLLPLLKIMLRDIGWVSLYLITAGIVFAGIIGLYRRQKAYWCLLLLPVGFTLLASGLQVYPFENRLLLFLLPILCLFIGEGTAHILQRARPYYRIFGIIALGIFYAVPLTSAAYALAHPRTHEEARPVMQYLYDHKQAGDIIYVYYAAHDVFTYYARRVGLQNEQVVQGIASRENWQRYLRDLQQLRGHPRVWLFFSHAYAEEAFFLHYLDTLGTQLDTYQDIRAAVYLYDLN